jgi:hypothetical protein
MKPQPLIYSDAGHLVSCHRLEDIHGFNINNTERDVI